jgi:membrane protein YqaA with SNARE-associated domain
LRAPEALTAFVRDALARGGERAAIAEAARSAGWTATETEAALATWVDAAGLPPVPRPRAIVSARDAFRHGLMFFALLLVTSHLGLLVFALIDRLLPDPLDPWSGGDGQIRWSIAVLIVAWPVWALTSLNLARDAERDPGQRRSAVGRWLTWGALFLAAATLVGDAIAIVAGFLGGDFGLRFLLKAVTVALIAGAIFLAYGGGREAEEGG